jgi:uncharacterized protein
MASFPERVVIVHGFTASPAAHWFPWLADQIEAGGASVEVVALPDSSAPTREGWERAIAKAVGTPDAGLWVVGHSLGCISALRALAGVDGDWALGGLVLVAGFDGPLDTIPALDGYLADGIADADLARIAARTRRIVTIRSDDDAVVPPEHSERLAARLRGHGASDEVRELPGAGHFVDREGWTELPLALAALHT